MDSLNCFDCKTWCDADQLVHYPDEGLYRCHECAYKHEKKQNAALESRLLEAEKLGAVAESVNLWLKRSNMGGTAHQRELESALAAFLAGGDTNKV